MTRWTAVSAVMMGSKNRRSSGVWANAIAPLASQAKTYGEPSEDIARRHDQGKKDARFNRRRQVAMVASVGPVIECKPYVRLGLGANILGVSRYPIDHRPTAKRVTAVSSTVMPSPGRSGTRI